MAFYYIITTINLGLGIFILLTIWTLAAVWDAQITVDAFLAISDKSYWISQIRSGPDVIRFGARQKSKRYALGNILRQIRCLLKNLNQQIWTYYTIPDLIMILVW